jgi:DNA polymerase-1
VLLYPLPQLAAVEKVDRPLKQSSDCQRCSLFSRAHCVCMPPDLAKEPGGALFVGEKPGREEDSRGKPQVGKTGTFLREAIAKHWTGPVSHENAVKCFPGDREPASGQIDECRPYVAATIDAARPSRIVCLGSAAVESVLGRGVMPYSVRRGYGWLAKTGVPVFMVIHPAAASRNRFVKDWFLRDLKWALTEMPQFPAPWQAECDMVTSAAIAKLARSCCEAAGGFSFDTETYGAPYDDDFRLLRVSVTPLGEDHSFVWDEKGLAKGSLSDALRDLLADRALRKAGQELKYDVHAVQLGLGARVRNQHCDVRLQRRLLDPDADGSLDGMSDLVGMGGYKDESEVLLKAMRRGAKAPNGQTSMLPDEERRGNLRYAFASLPPEVLTRRCALDSIATARLAGLLEPQIVADERIDRTWRKLVRPAAEAIQQVEAWGIGVNRDAIEAADLYLTRRLEDVRRRLSTYGEFNPDSPKQLGEMLYGKLKLRPPSKTDTGAPSTDKDALEALADAHPIVTDVLEYRHLGTWMKNYGKGRDGKGGLYVHVRSDGRIHPTINPDGARTGRLSCERPALHGIPRPDEDRAEDDGKMIRDAFVARLGWRIMSFDYSQIELRIAAWMSGDKAMQEVFLSGADYHRRTAELIAPTAWGMRPEDVHKPQRSKAKIVNFGLIYGKTDRTLARELGCSVEEAHAIRLAILGKFDRLHEWMRQCVAWAKKHGEVWTWWEGKPARRRPMWRIADPDDGVRITAENGAINTPIQGTANEFCLRSLVEVVRWILEEGVPALLVLPVHDALVLEVREDAVQEVGHEVPRIMQSWDSGGVPLIVDSEEGPSWGTLTKLVLKEAA